MKAHPWLMGFYTAVACGGIFGLLALLGKGITEAGAATIGVFWFLVMWPFTAVSIKRGWWERREASQEPAEPRSQKGSWSRTSDSGLPLGIGLCSLGVVATGYGLLTGRNSLTVFLVMAGINLGIVTSFWRELKRRKQTGGRLL